MTAEGDQFKLFPFLNKDDTIVGLKQELPTYMAQVEGVRLEDGEQMAWWYHQRQCLPCWSSAAKLLSPVQPSFASAELVFSFLQAAFSDQRVGTLEDDLEASVMLAYNYRTQ